jgi:hypothetical protein
MESGNGMSKRLMAALGERQLLAVLCPSREAENDPLRPFGRRFTADRSSAKVVISLDRVGDSNKTQTRRSEFKAK